MKKHLLVGGLLAVSMLSVPAVAVQARRGSDDPTGHVRQEDKQPTATGSVLSQTTTPTTSNNSAVTPSPSSTQTTVTIKDALEAAEKQFPDKTIVRIQKETEHGKNVWDVRFSDNTRVYVDASTGEVVQIKDKTNDKDHSNSGRDHSEDD